MTTNRAFRDSNGILWRVSLIESEPVSSPEGDSAWLLFEAVWMQRRLSPVPESWQTATEYRLEQMCRVAKPTIGYERTRSLTPASSDQYADMTPTVEPDESLSNHPPTTKPEPGAQGISVLADAWPPRDVHISFRG